MVIRDRGQQYADQKQRTNADGELCDQLQQRTAAKHSFSKFKRDAQFVLFNNTDARDEMFLPISYRVPQ